MSTRRQASLYLTGVPKIEEIPRLRFNPAQAELIPAHVTLCREDEVLDWTALRHRLSAICPIEVVIEFGTPVRQGNLVYLPAIGQTEQFDNLRRDLLGAEGQKLRKHLAHITIIHPRNGSRSDADFQEITESLERFTAKFREVSLIEQQDGGHWCHTTFP